MGTGTGVGDEVSAALAVPDVRWSVSLRTVGDGEGAEIAASHADRVLSTASVGKLLLLLEVARQYDAGSLAPTERLARAAHLDVGDSGLWQHLAVEALAVEDLAILVGSVSDNLATNVLLERVGPAQVQRTAEAAGLRHTRLLDRVRDRRGPEDPARLSEGSAGELSGLMADLAAGRLLSAAVAARLDRWLAAGTDLSMVAGAFGLDPLAHAHADRGLVLRHKTGTDAGVRADVGLVRGPRGTVAYAVLANWDDREADRRDDVLASMRAVGALVRGLVT